MSRIPPAPLAMYPKLKKAQRAHIGVLKERRDYLSKRIQQVPEHASSYHASEIAALSWVLDLIDQQYAQQSTT